MIPVSHLESLYVFNTFTPSALNRVERGGQLHLAQAAQSVADELKVKDRMLVREALLGLNEIVPLDSRERAQQFFSDLGSVSPFVPTTLSLAKFQPALVDVGRAMRSRLTRTRSGCALRQRVAELSDEPYEQAIRELAAQTYRETPKLELTYSVFGLSQEVPAFLAAESDPSIAGPVISVLYFQISRTLGLKRRLPSENLLLTAGLAVYPIPQANEMPTIVMEESLHFTRANATHDESLTLASILRAQCDPNRRYFENTVFDGGKLPRHDSREERRAALKSARQACQGTAWVHSQLYDIFLVK